MVDVLEAKRYEKDLISAELSGGGQENGAQNRLFLAAKPKDCDIDSGRSHMLMMDSVASKRRLRTKKQMVSHLHQ